MPEMSKNGVPLRGDVGRGAGCVFDAGARMIILLGYSHVAH